MVELRWASITLLTMALLSIGARWLEPLSGDFDQMIVLNGAQGLSEVLAQALSQGITGLKLARGVLHNELGGNGKDTNGAGHEVEAAPVAADPPAG